jgi:hypothetical protein
MAFVERLLGRTPRPPEIDLRELLPALAAAVATQAERHAVPDLVRARLADRCRDAAVVPLLPAEFDALVVGLDGEAWRRLALLVGALDLAGVRAALPALLEARPLSDLVAGAFVGLARATPLLTVELLRQGPLRVEELARKFIDRIGAAVKGEKARESRAQLYRLDYERLLAEAERARQAAAERMEQLRKLQDAQEAKRPRRGKW